MIFFIGLLLLVTTPPSCRRSFSSLRIQTQYEIMMPVWGSSSQGNHGVECIASGGSPTEEVMHGFNNATEINEEKSFGRWPFYSIKWSLAAGSC